MAEIYELPISFEPRVASEHLGRQKYTTPGRALGELVANAFDAGATRVSVDVEANELGVETAVTVTDNGSGMSFQTLRDRFAVVGVSPEGDGAQHFGRFGVGRLAAHRIGAISMWLTTARLPDGTLQENRFALDIDRPESLRVQSEVASASAETGTSIRIENLNDSGRASLQPTRLANDLRNQFCSFLLGTADREIVINGEAVKVREWIKQEEVEELTLPHDIKGAAGIRHLVLVSSTSGSRFDGQILYTAKGRTVHWEQPELTLAPNYLALAECDYLDAIVTSNRESLIELDEGFAQIRERVLDQVGAFQVRLREDRARRFIEVARERPYYPYRGIPRDAVSAASQALYDVVLERVHEHANLERMTQSQQAVVFRLLRRAMENEDLLEILEEVAGLSDQDLEQFRRVLEKTTLQSIIRLSGEVTSRLEFLDLLHAMVYGEPSRYLRERTELHKILEPYCWLFGERFHLATSDQGFRKVIAAHRAEAGLPEVEVAAETPGLDQIPDLFLAAQREYGAHHPTDHLLVEIKAPKVNVGTKEEAQIRRYAEVVRKSPEFDQKRVLWDLYVVSSDITDSVEENRNQANREPGVLFQWRGMTVWALKWSEVIQHSRDELHLVSKHLERKSKELSVSTFLRENFPSVLEGLAQRMGGDPN